MVSPPATSPPSPERRRGARLPPLTALLLLLAPAHTHWACATDVEADCQATYRHLLKVAHRHHDPEAMESFVTACLDHYDPKRLQCLREASTPGAALACKPHKKRPD